MNKVVTPPHNSLSDRRLVKRKRSAGLDIVRTIACVSVIASHFFLHTDFNTYTFSGVSMYLQGMLSSIVVGSDIYMILTGFLCCNKTLGNSFYKSGLKVILSYIFFSLITIVVNIYLFHTGMTWKQGILGILSFSTIPYAWYIEMWIGLFLLAPFLNIWYKALPSKKTKLYLIGLLFVLTILPDFFNRYGYYLVPQYWENVYPLAFYFVGCYIREYRPQPSKYALLLLILLISMINSSVTMLVGYPKFLHFIGDRNGIFMATLACAIFLCFYQQDIKSKIVTNIFKTISLRSLDIFLCSAIFDFYLYPLFKEQYYVDQSQYGIFYFIIVPLIFIICYSIASLKRILFNIAGYGLRKLGIEIDLQSKG